MRKINEDLLPSMPMHKGWLFLHNTGGQSQFTGYTEQQMREYALAAATAQWEDIVSIIAAWKAILTSSEEYPEAAAVCAEAYQVVSILLEQTGQFDTPRAQHLLDNLSQHRLVHKEILPWLDPMPPKGYVLVPVEPTGEMLMAAKKHDYYSSKDPSWRDLYQVMIAARPEVKNGDR